MCCEHDLHDDLFRIRWQPAISSHELINEAVAVDAGSDHRDAADLRRPLDRNCRELRWQLLRELRQIGGNWRPVNAFERSPVKEPFHSRAGKSWQPGIAAWPQTREKLTSRSCAAFQRWTFFPRLIKKQSWLIVSCLLLSCFIKIILFSLKLCVEDTHWEY